MESLFAQVQPAPQFNPFGALGIISILFGVVSLVCYIMVVIQMFQHGQSGLGIAAIVLLHCFGIGALLAFVYGWVKAGEWKIQNVMIAWTAVVVINVVLNGYIYATMPPVVIAS